MSDIEKGRHALEQRLLEGDGRASTALRRAAFHDERASLPEAMRPLAEKIVGHAADVRDEDIEALHVAGISEDELFELVICVAVGEVTREHQAALAALDAAIEKA